MKMTPRISKPEKGNKYYINKNDGGFNPAKGNPKSLNKDLTALPNCVAIYGWFNEPGQNGMQYLKKAYYPYSVIKNAQYEGLIITKEPTLGGIMVWTGGKTGEGHVAGVGQIVDKNHILSVESEYYGKDWVNFNRYKGNGNWADGCYWMNSSYKYQGCIKNPFIKQEEDMTKAETEALIKQMVPKILADLEDERKQASAHSWAKPYIDWAKEKGILTEDTEGNFRPLDPLTREEAAAVSKAVIKTITDKLDTLVQ